MTELHFCGALVIWASCVARAQDIPQPPPMVRPNVEVRVSGLPSLRAQSGDAPDVLATSLATILHDRSLCCGRDSALADRLPQSNPVSLKEVAAKLQGRQLLSDGRPILVTAEYVAANALNSGQLVGALLANRAPLMEWNSHLYVVCGAIFDEAEYSDGTITYAIRKILLLDTRFSDSRREVAFDRGKDDLGKVQGVLFLTVAPQ